MTSAPATPRREFLMALVTWSAHHVWIEAVNEDAAAECARQLWSEDESAFSYKDGGIDGISVLDSRELQALTTAGPNCRKGRGGTR